MANSKQQIWWESFSKDEQDCINRSIFNKKIFDLDKAYTALSQFIR